MTHSNILGPAWPSADAGEQRPKTVEIPPERPYHQLARNEAHRWWRPLAGTAGIIGAVFVVGAIGTGLDVLVLGIKSGSFDGLDLDAPGPTPIFGNAVLDTIFSSVLATLALLAIFSAVLAMAPAAQKRPAGTLSSVTGRVRWRWLAVCLALAAGLCATLVVVTALLVGASINGSAIADTMHAEDASRGWAQVVDLPRGIIAIVFFEYLFRGWILQAVGACTLETRRGRFGRALSVVFRTPWPAIVISAALVAAGLDYGAGDLSTFVVAVIAGWVAVRTGGLEASLALVVVFGVGAGLHTADGEDPSWQSAIFIGGPLLFAAAIAWLSRRRHLQTISAPSSGPHSSMTGPLTSRRQVLPHAPERGQP